MSRARLVLVGLIATAAAMFAVDELAAQADKAALVKARQDEMSQMNSAFGPLGRVVRGESQNMADAVASAETMSANAKKIVGNFPSGTGREAVPDTRAKPEIWSRRAEFEAAAAKLAEESDKLLAAAKSNDVAALRAQFGPFGQACGGCHEGPVRSGGTFRFERQ